VGVDVEDGLAGGFSGVEDDSVAGFGDAFGFGYLPGLVGQFVEEAVTGLGHRGQVGVVLLGHYEYVGGCLRVNIPERERTWTLEDAR
jgi:hypothetical protein